MLNKVIREKLRCVNCVTDFYNKSLIKSDLKKNNPKLFI